MIKTGTAMRAQIAAILMLFAQAAAALSPQELARLHASQVDWRLTVPPEEQKTYSDLLGKALAKAGIQTLAPQYILVVDRSPHVQAIFIYWGDPISGWTHVGASPVSTGRPGEFDHFITPTGVYAHTPANPDFRAEGTKNDKGIRGYGVKGMRVFDFGWTMADRGWGIPGRSQMRLQLHATDPVLEKHFGMVQSKGCIRVPATLNQLIDRHALIDADYEEAAARGQQPWVLRKDMESTRWSGRYLVIVDSERTSRPAWSPYPAVRRKPASPVAEYKGDVMPEPAHGCS